jgi:MFS family permease
MPGRRTAISTGDSPLPVALVFTSNGFALAALLSRIPDIRDQVGASPTQLAFALVCQGVGALAGMPFTGRLIGRYSTKWVNRVSATIRLAGYIAVPMIRSVAFLAFVFLIIRIGAGTGSVAMNVQGHLVERRSARPWMPFWHGLFSFGAAAGALAGALAVSLHISLAWQMLVVSLVLHIVIWIATRDFVVDSGVDLSGRDAGVIEPIFDEPEAFVSKRVLIPRFGRPAITLTEILLGVIAFVTLVGEGTANNWLAVMLVDNRGVPAAFGALTYAGFNATMAIGRFTGGIFIRRFGRTPVLRVAGVFASAGLATLCLIYSIPIALLGSLALGLGLSIGFPSVMSAAGETPGRGSGAIALASTIAAGGSLLAAPSIGFLAGVMRLDRALLIVAVLLLLISILAPCAREQRLARPDAKKQVVGERSSR